MRRTIPAVTTPVHSPYDVPATSVAPAPTGEGPLLPFEQDQLNRLINQIRAAPQRVRTALAEQVFSTVNTH